MVTTGKKGLLAYRYIRTVLYRGVIFARGAREFLFAERGPPVPRYWPPYSRKQKFRIGFLESEAISRRNIDYRSLVLLKSDRIVLAISLVRVSSGVLERTINISSRAVATRRKF